MKLTYVLDERGEPAHEPDAAKFATWFAAMFDNDEHVVSHQRFRDRFGRDVLVSSVYLGMNVEGTEPPTLWETMVFGGTVDGLRIRHASRDMALLGSGFACGLAYARHDVESAASRCREIFRFASTGVPDAIQRSMHTRKAER